METYAADSIVNDMEEVSGAAADQRSCTFATTIRKVSGVVFVRRKAAFRRPSGSVRGAHVTEVIHRSSSVDRENSRTGYRARERNPHRARHVGRMAWELERRG